MDTETANEAHSHGNRELCAPAIRLYEEALRKGRIARSELAPAPCLVEMALLHPDPRDDAWMRPVPPSTGLAHLLQPITREIEERVQLTAALSKSLAPLVAVATEDLSLAITVLEGPDVIQAALKEATATAREEVLTAQPGSRRPSELLPQALANAQTAIDHGARLRHIYQHPARYSTAVRDYLEQVPSDHLKVRTTERTVDRLIIFDRQVAFIPATPDRNAALEIRNPAIVRYLIQVYEMLWEQAIPFTEQLPTAAPGIPVTAVQHSIARLLVEGHVDDIVARKLGISVRTCRAHIAKLMQALGASSRTHLGALLVQSGLVDLDGPHSVR
ncbi:helix-turn-helix transcriptional regulator [Streptomyces sp. NBC_00234]|uniref:helix-turn-helix transcriptional regulator n=1 Tax=Streptomyces sp. NBC_00234 TaxID=2903638 RepID=UPI002E2C090B|nr:helix-turn-helix transcriptional regulator [Streptomyces sp. NBC_00234]